MGIQTSISINRLSAKGTDGVMKPAADRLPLLIFICYTASCRMLAYYRTRGGKWWGCIAATPHFYMGRLSVKAPMNGANK